MSARRIKTANEASKTRLNAEGKPLQLSVRGKLDVVIMECRNLKSKGVVRLFSDKAGGVVRRSRGVSASVEGPAFARSVISRERLEPDDVVDQVPPTGNNDALSSTVALQDPKTTSLVSSGELVPAFTSEVNAFSVLPSKFSLSLLPRTPRVDNDGQEHHMHDESNAVDHTRSKGDFSNFSVAVSGGGSFQNADDVVDDSNFDHGSNSPSSLISSPGKISQAPSLSTSASLAAASARHAPDGTSNHAGTTAITRINPNIRPRGESAGNTPIIPLALDRLNYLADHSGGFSNSRQSSVEFERTKPPMFAYAIVQIDQQQEHTPCAPRFTPEASSARQRDDLSYAPWNHRVIFDVTSPNSMLSISIWGTYSNEGGQYPKGPDPINLAESSLSISVADKRFLPRSLSRPPVPRQSDKLKPHYNTVGEFLGRFRIPTTALQHGKPIEDWFRLSTLDREEDIPGSVRVRIQFTPSVTDPAERTPLFNSPKDLRVLAPSSVGLKDFVLLKVVGRGTFAKVLQVRKVDTGRLYAMKTIKKDHVIEQNAVRHTLSEKSVLERLHHPFIVNLKFAFQTRDRLVLVLDYISGGELFYHLSEARTFSESRARFYAAEIASALGYLHSKNIIYRDLKPENMLLDTDGHVILTDFGLCKDNLGFGERAHTFCGSPEYIAPEMLCREPYDRGVDWWALGTFLFEMMAGLPPYFSLDEDEMNRRILYEKLSFPSHFSKNAQNVLCGLLERDPRRRLGAGPTGFYEVKTHPFFAEHIDFDMLEAKCIPPPMRPPLTSETDVRFFDPDVTRELPQFSIEEPRLTEREQQDYFAGFAYTAPDIDLNQVKHTNHERHRRFNSTQSQYSQQSSSTCSSEVTSTTECSRPGASFSSGPDRAYSPIFHTPQPVRNDERIFDFEHDDGVHPAGYDGPFDPDESDGYYSDPDRNAQRAAMLKRSLKPHQLVRSSSHEMFARRSLPVVADDAGNRTRANALRPGPVPFGVNS